MDPQLQDEKEPNLDQASISKTSEKPTYMRKDPLTHTRVPETTLRITNQGIKPKILKQIIIIHRKSKEVFY